MRKKNLMAGLFAFIIILFFAGCGDNLFLITRKPVNEYVEVVEKIININSGIYWPVFVQPADINLDGHMDVVFVRDFMRGASWFENPGPGEHTWGGPHTISLNDGIAFALPADVDNDGDLDVISITAFNYNHPEQKDCETLIQKVTDTMFTGGELAEVVNSYIAWWENESPVDTNKPSPESDWIKHPVTYDLFFYPRCLTIADIDGDENIDLIGVIRFQTSELEGLILQGYLNMPQDIKNRGPSREYIVYEKNESVTNKVCWWEYTGDETQAWTLYEIVTGIHQPTFADTADIDGDGRMDIVCTFSAPVHKILWFKNKLPRQSDGTLLNDGSEWEQKVLVDNYQSGFELCTGDIDGEGSPDIVSSAYDGDKIHLWLNMNNGAAWHEEIIVSQFKTPGSLSLADMDEDGDLDLLSATLSHGSTIGWFENLNNWDDPQADHWKEHFMSKEYSSGTTCYPVDINGDGHLDILGSSSNLHRISWWDNYSGSIGNWPEH